MSDSTPRERAQSVARQPALGEKVRLDWSGYIFVAFFTVPFFLFNILPVMFGAYVAFTEWSIIGAPRWVGVKNFARAIEDEWVINSFQNAVWYGVVIVPGVTVLGLAAAIFVNQRWPLSALARTLFFAPYVVSATVIGLIWVWLLDTQYGLINHFLGYLDPLDYVDRLGPLRCFDRVDLVGHGVGIHPLSRCAARHPKGSDRGVGRRRGKQIQAIDLHHAAHDASRNFDGCYAANDFDAANFQPSLCHD